MKTFGTFALTVALTTAAFASTGMTVAAAQFTPTVTPNVPLNDHLPPKQVITIEAIRTGNYTGVLTPRINPQVPAQCVFVAKTVNFYITRTGDDLTFSSPEGYLVGKIDAHGHIVMHTVPHATAPTVYGFTGDVTGPGAMSGIGKTRCDVGGTPWPSDFNAVLTGGPTLIP